MSTLIGANQGYGYDSVNPNLIPQNAHVVFPYDDGLYKWDAKQYFPSALHKGITVLGGLASPIADVERYDLTPDDGIRWAKSRFPEYGAGTIYCSIDPLGYIASGLVGTPHFYFVADPTGVAHMYNIPGCVSTQYGGVVNQYDISLVDLDWMNGTVTPANPTPTAPCIGGKLTASGKGYYIFGADGGVFTYGDAVFHGSAFGKIGTDVIVGFDVLPDNSGYILFGRDYGVFNFGTPYLGHPGA